LEPSARRAAGRRHAAAGFVAGRIAQHRCLVARPGAGADKSSTATQPSGVASTSNGSSSGSSKSGSSSGLIVGLVALAVVDIDSSMPNASARGKDEYAKALDCHDQAERRLKNADDDYQFERALAALKEGLEHVLAAGQVLNQPDAPAPTPPA
jgi:hypothetical protein